MADPAKSASSSAADMAVESARFKIAETRGFLEKQEMLYDEGNKQLKESNKELKFFIALWNSAQRRLLTLTR